VQAHTGLPVSVKVHGLDAKGRLYADHFFMGGGQGASAAHDGKSALLWPTSAANTSIELFETRSPVLVVEKSLVVDSGGAGQHRGGLGTRTRMRKLHDDGLPTQASVAAEGVGVDSPGLFGGLQGGAARGAVLDREGNLIRDCGTGELVTLTDTSRMIEVRLCGGSGFGAPEARSAALVERDLLEGYVSPGAARAAAQAAE
jgi:5-oxoprolinase (ATP-hydrolysing)/N-methylhydantoinase A